MTINARAALLDMDGTLVNSIAAVERIWLAWAAGHGLDPERVLSVVHGRQGHQSMAILLPERPHEQNLIDNAALLAKESGDVKGVVEIAGAAGFLTALRDQPHAIVTSADLALMNARMGAARLTVPELHITAEDVSASKPDPEGFLKAAAMLGVAPADCVVFEDSEAGIAAGLAAGMRVIGVGPHAAGLEPTFHVDDLTQVAVAAASDGFTLSIR